MALLVILTFLATPFIEIALFIRVGEWLGALPTIGLTILTSVIGLAIVRGQGVSNLVKMQKAFSENDLPIAEMIHAMFISLAGLLLIIPGFFTDFLGILLLIPPLRSLMGQKLISRMRVTVQAASGGSPGSRPWGDGQSGVVDAEFWEESGNRDDPKHHRLPPRAND